MKRQALKERVQNITMLSKIDVSVLLQEILTMHFFTTLLLIKIYELL